MNQDPPVLQPIDEKEFFNSVDIQPSDKIFTTEHRMNGYLNNTSGTVSPPMPILYQADREPPNMLNLQDFFSALSQDAFDTNIVDYSKLEPRKESVSLFEKIYKDYSTTLTQNSNITDSVQDSTVSPQQTPESEINYSKIEIQLNNAKEINDDAILQPIKEIDVSLKSKIKTEIPKKAKKRKFKKNIEPVNIDDSYEQIRSKFVTKPLPDNVKNSQYKDCNDNKYLKSPFITLRNRSPKKQSQTINIISTEYEIVNPSVKGNVDYQISIYRPNLKLLNGNQYLSPHQCICAFCGKTSDFLKLGSLYGPYFIDTESIPGLPLTCIFSSDNQQDSVVGVSGKSAIKTDKNGGLKMVIQSTKSGRNSTSKKVAVEDYRITWEGEVWFHRECILWAPCTFLKGNGKIGGLEEALKMALNAECSVCHKVGAILNCTTKNCDKNFHYYCAISLGSKLNNEQFSMLCNKHKEK